MCSFMRILFISITGSKTSKDKNILKTHAQAHFQYTLFFSCIFSLRTSFFKTSLYFLILSVCLSVFLSAVLCLLLYFSICLGENNELSL